MAKWIKGGVPREFVLSGREFTPAEGETATYMLSGRGGPVHIGGNFDIYKESNPYLGGVNQSLSCDEDAFIALKELQESAEKITGYMTMPSGETFNLFGGIGNDGALELDNGVVAVEFRGNVEKQ
jgi:hypothetical protein